MPRVIEVTLSDGRRLWVNPNLVDRDMSEEKQVGAVWDLIAGDRRSPLGFVVRDSRGISGETKLNPACVVSVTIRIADDSERNPTDRG